MTSRTIAILAVSGVLAISSAARSEVIWWDYEYDGAVSPTAASPLWTVNNAPTGSAQTEGSTTYWHISSPTDIWAGYMVDAGSPTWSSNGNDTTLEVRFRVHADNTNSDTNSTALGTEDAQIRVTLPREWALRVENDAGGDVLKFRQGTQTVVTADDEWNIVRIIYSGGNATAYVLPGGAMSGNGGAWQVADTSPVTSSWTGFNTADPNRLLIAGNIDVDYVRWAHDGQFAPAAVPEPSAAALFGAGAGWLLAVRRRRR